MPTYDYHCDACGHDFELFQPMNSKPQKTCPECKARKARRLIGTGGGILFKGSGFYETDYRSANYQKRAKEETSSSSSASDKGSDKKSESKSDTKASPASTKSD